jgi:A/G-specific adenine glycosylase
MMVHAEFAPRLIAWQQAHGRHDLPWQQSHDAYRVWLSEIMLQQTQVSSVMAYYTRFLERFPDVEALAAASLDEVMALWSGLGYYTRARNLHRCAQQVVEQHGGRFPAAPEALSELPGIGRSTAAAIAAFAYGVRSPILDGNVKRVLARTFGIEGFPGEKKIENAMWTLAEALLPEAGANEAETHARMRSYTQGLMDLGATLCVRGQPQCARCPFEADCEARLSGRQRVLPQARPRKPVPTRRTWMLILRHQGRVLLERRPPEGIWGGLWSLPQAPDEASLSTYAQRFGAASEFSRLGAFSHTFTHFKLEIEPRLAELERRALAAHDGDDQAWVALGEIGDYGLPAPVRRLLEGLGGDLI